MELEEGQREGEQKGENGGNEGVFIGKEMGPAQRHLLSAFAVTFGKPDNGLALAKNKSRKPASNSD